MLLIRLIISSSHLLNCLRGGCGVKLKTFLNHILGLHIVQKTCLLKEQLSYGLLIFRMEK